MGADEEGTLERLKALRRELLDPKIAEHHGRIVKTTGDGLLVEFASILDAVRCAVEVQEAMAERFIMATSGETVTYAELEARSNRLAHFLRAGAELPPRCLGGALPSRRAGKRAQFLGRVLRSWLLPVIFNTVLTGSGRASLNTRFRSLAE